MQQRAGQRVRVTWPQERPKKLGGSWGLGCGACAALHARTQGLGKLAGRHQCQRWTSKWARYEVRSLSQMQASALANHAQGQMRQHAVRLMNAPDQPLESVSLMPASDEQLLRGSVPGPDSWLRAWRMVQSPTSFSKAEKHSHTESYISIRQGQCSRHMYKQMLQRMVEVVRRKKRSVIKSARHISVALDDKAPFRILRFRAVSASASETPAIEKLASDPTGTDGDAVDQELVQHFLSNVISCSTDGASAMRKSMSVMRVTTLPNLRVMVIDRAHNIRRAGLPLTLESRFWRVLEAFWDRCSQPSKFRAMEASLPHAAECKWQQ